MPPCTNTVNKKCGEIIITIKKNAKNVYSFNCWFCDTPTPYIQMKKFSWHLEQEHKHQLELSTNNGEETTNCQEDSIPDMEISTTDRLFMPEIKVEDYLVDDIKLENEEEHPVVTRNSKMKENHKLFRDPLETIENTPEEVLLPVQEIQQVDDNIFAEIIDTKIESLLKPETVVPKEDIEFQTYSEDNDDVNDSSDSSGDENSSSSGYRPEDDYERPKKLVKHKNTISDKELTIALINAFENMPQLWDTSQSEKCSVKQREELLQTITNNLNVQLKINMKLYMIKKKISELCRNYEKELEGRVAEKKKKNAKNSDLWYYELMEFLKPSTENKIKHRGKKTKHRVKPLSDKLMNNLIDIYKNYNSLWDVNHLAFTIKERRRETMQTMLDEIKTKMNLSLDIYKLKKHIGHIHKSYAKDKQHKLECEIKQEDFQPSCCHYSKCDFLDLHQGPFRCSTCNEIIETYRGLQIHRSTHDGAAPFKCQECGKCFKRHSNFKLHAKRHLRLFKFHCKICGKGYPLTAELDLHMRSHTGAMPYLCSVCGKGFRTAIGYDNHIRRHEERFKYFCHICKRGFNHMTRLNDHVKTHLNVRDNICNICGKGFKLRRYLNYHKRIHEGKNYSCNICGKSFAQGAGLRAHKKYHINSIQKERNKYNVLS